MDNNSQILQEQRKTNRLLSILVTKDLPRSEQILVLKNSGFKPSEIAELIGTTANTVSVTLAKSKKRKPR